MKNRITINGTPFVNPSPKQVTSALLECVLSDDLQYWSPQALFNLYMGIMELVVETIEWLKSQPGMKGQRGGNTTRLQKQITRDKLKVKHAGVFPQTKDTLKQMYQQYLASNGLGGLHGFGVTNRYGDRLGGNPEYS